MRFINGILMTIAFALTVMILEELRGAPYSEEMRVLALLIGASTGFTVAK